MNQAAAGDNKRVP